MNDMTHTPSIEDRIAAKTDLAVAGATEVSAQVGGLAFKDMSQVMEFSKLMAVSGQAVPKHLRASPGACLAVSLQALNWRMDPFAVANKSYAVNDRIAYEAQLIHAVIEQRAPIRGRIKGKVDGKDATRRWTLTVTLNDGDELVFEGQEFGKITTKNSPLWKADPDQQLWYYTVRAMARRHFPDVILGVYEREELRAEMRDITPETERPAPRRNLAQRLQEPEEPEIIPPQEDPAPIDYAAIDVADAFPGSEAWQRGEMAREDGQPITACPFDDFEEARDWCGGWHEAEARGK